MSKDVEFKIDDKVLLWDLSHAKRWIDYKFQKLWLGPFKIIFILGTNSYLLKDLGLLSFNLCCLFHMIIGNKLWISFAITMSLFKYC
jgi:hypothetical protein